MTLAHSKPLTSDRWVDPGTIASAPIAPEVGIVQSLWTARDVANHLRCSTKTVLTLVRREGLPCLRLRSRLRFDPSDVLRWVAARKEVA